MRKVLAGLLIVTSLPLLSSASNSILRDPPPSKKADHGISLRIKDIEKMRGRKLSLKEKIAVIILRTKLKHAPKEDKQPGNLALIFGISAAATFLLGLLVPPILFASLAAAIVAIVLGSNAKRKNPSDGKARAAVLLGWITLGLLALLTVVAVIALAEWGV